MPYNGTGTFNQLYNFNTEASSPPIEITKLQAECEDMASALSNCITRDGQGKPTANQDFNGKNLTNVNTFSANSISSLGSMSCVGVLSAGDALLGAITATSLNNTPVGNTTPSTGAFTTLTSSGTTTLGAVTAASINGTTIGASVRGNGSFANLTANFLDNTPIGTNTRSTGAFTTLQSNSTTTLGATTATSINSTPIGATTRSTGAFTTLSSNSTTTLGATTATSLNSTPIGAGTPSSGAFTTLSATGDVSFSRDPSLPTQTGFKNYIINGAMDIAQRGTSFNLSSTIAYTLDRWQISTSGGTISCTQYNSSSFTANLFDNIMGIVGDPSNTSVIVRQNIESALARGLAGKTAIVSFYTYRVSGTVGTINVRTSYANSLNNFSSTNLISNDTVNISNSSLQKHVLYISVPSLAYNGFQLAFHLGAVNSSETCFLTGVSVMPFQSTTADPAFEYRPPAYEYLMCTRYAYLAADRVNTGGCASAGTAVMTRYQFPSLMRATPSVSLYNTGTYNISDDFSGEFTATTTSLGGVGVSQSGGRVSLSGFSGLTVGRYYGTGLSAGNARVLFDAEL